MTQDGHRFRLQPFQPVTPAPAPEPAPAPAPEPAPAPAPEPVTGGPSPETDPWPWGDPEPVVEPEPWPWRDPEPSPETVTAPDPEPAPEPVTAPAPEPVTRGPSPETDPRPWGDPESSFIPAAEPQVRESNTRAEGEDPAAAAAPKRNPRRLRRGNTKASPPSQEQTPSRDLLNIPVPGGRLSRGRGAALGLRWAILALITLLSLSTCGLGGFLATRLTTRAAVSEADLAPFHITTWNGVAGTAFATSYLRACLTRAAAPESGLTDPDRARVDRVTAMSATGADPACASGGGSARTVLDIAPASNPEPVADMPSARYVSLVATTSDGVRAVYTVPVYLSDPQTGQGPRVVGPIGMMPVAQPGVPTKPATERPTDAQLASELRGTFVSQFMLAWASSTGLDQFLATSADESARVGLAGVLRDVKVASVIVYPGTGAARSGAQSWSYPPGATATVEVGITATLTATGNRQASTYRVELLRVGEHWFVTAVNGGSLGVINPGAAVVALPEPVPTVTPAPTVTPTP